MTQPRRRRLLMLCLLVLLISVFVGLLRWLTVPGLTSSHYPEPPAAARAPFRLAAPIPAAPIPGPARSQNLPAAPVPIDELPPSQRDVSSVAAILRSQDLPDPWMVRQFLALVAAADLPVQERLHALNEALDRIQLDEEEPLIAFVQGHAQLPAELVIRLWAESDTRSIFYRFDLNFHLLSHSDPVVRGNARKVLKFLVDNDYGDSPAAWVAPGEAAKKVWAE